MSAVLKLEYNNSPVEMNDEGWFNATIAAEQFGKRPTDWLSLDSTKEYITALCEMIRSEKSQLLKVKRAGRGKSDSTWFHPDLAVPFARWLDIKFSIWCDQQIKNLLRGTHPFQNWKRLRHEATASHKVMNAVLVLQRQQQNKLTKSHHFANEVRLVNWALTGQFDTLDRNALPETELDLLSKLEEHNTVLIGNGLNYQERKLALESFTANARHRVNLEVAK